MAHCGPTLKGEFARTLNLTDVHTGWVFTRIDPQQRPCPHPGRTQSCVCTKSLTRITGLDFDNGTEFLNTAGHHVGRRARASTSPAHAHTRRTTRPPSSRRTTTWSASTAFYYRYDTAEERAVLNRLWKLVNDRLNYLTPTMKPIGYGSSADGRRRRLYDTPQTPLDRLLAAGVLSRGPTGRADRLPRQSQPRRDRPRNRRPAEPTPPAGQGENRTALPRQHPDRPTRRPQRHPNQGQLTPPVSRAFLPEASDQFSRAS